MAFQFSKAIPRFLGSREATPPGWTSATKPPALGGALPWSSLPDLRNLRSSFDLGGASPFGGAFRGFSPAGGAPAAPANLPVSPPPIPSLPAAPGPVPPAADPREAQRASMLAALQAGDLPDVSALTRAAGLANLVPPRLPMIAAPARPDIGAVRRGLLDELGPIPPVAAEVASPVTALLNRAGGIPEQVSQAVGNARERARAALLSGQDAWQNARDQLLNINGLPNPFANSIVQAALRSKART